MSLFKAIFTDGELRPVGPVTLTEGQLVACAVGGGPTMASLDLEYVAYCQRLTAAGPEVSLEEVRAALSAIPGSMTQDFIDEREER